MKTIGIIAITFLALPLVAQQKATPMPTEPSKKDVITADEVYTMAASISVAKRFCSSGPKQGLKEIHIYAPEDHTWMVLTCHDAGAQGLFSLQYPDFIDQYKIVINTMSTLPAQFHDR